MRLTYAVRAFLFMASVVVVSCSGSGRAASQAKSNGGPSTPVIVELFTSEGCSSCPPADELLKKMSEEQPIEGAQVVALEEHVDYWNHLGWKDPYSSWQFSERQNVYARSFGTDSVYTPQMVVDGQTEFVGNQGRKAHEIIKRAASLPRAHVTLQQLAGPANGSATFTVKVEGLAGVPNAKDTELWVALTEKNLHTDVKAGENSGENLQHAAVVRTLRKVEALAGTDSHASQVDLKLADGWKPENLAVVAFVVVKNSQRIVGAGMVAFAPATISK
jgi:hypothetical protein